MDELGAHRRVAGAIAKLVEHERGGGAIGLEGEWGSGKSTIVNLIAERFQSRNDIAVVCFDAWAHQGDALRRSFLEEIMIGLEPWANDGGNLRRIFEETRTRLTEKRTRPELSGWGQALVVAALLSPVGVGMMRQDWGNLVLVGHELAPGFLLSLLLAGCPALVVFVWYLAGLVGRKSPGEGRRSVPFVGTVADTVHSAEPTSIEFAECFKKLLAPPLSSCPQRRVLLVFDNLDRLDVGGQKAAWATLQVFLRKPCFERTWVLVPFDRVRVSNEASSDANDREEDGDGLLGKMLTVRFHVPPPVLKDWKAFLVRQLIAAMPEHDRKDWHGVYRVFSACRKTGGGEPTAREIKLFVNQLGAVHRQWQDQYPMEHVAYFVLQKRRALSGRLRKGYQALGAPSFFDASLMRSLAGLWFNVPREDAIELLLRPTIEDALISGDGQILATLLEQHGDAFVEVLEALLVRVNLPDPTKVLSAAVAFEAARLFSEAFAPSDPVVLDWFRRHVQMMNGWVPTGNGAGGAQVLLKRLPDAGSRSALLQKLSAGLEQQAPENEMSAASWISQILELLRSPEAKGCTFPPLPLRGNLAVVLLAVEILVKGDLTRKYARHFAPKVNPLEVHHLLKNWQAPVDNLLTTLTFFARQQGSQYLESAEWKPVLEAILPPMSLAGSQVDFSAELEWRVRWTWVLAQAGVRSAEDVVEHVARWAVPALLDNEDPSFRALGMVLAMKVPEQATSGSLTRVLDDPSLAEVLCTLIEAVERTDLIEFIQARGQCDRLVAKCLQHLVVKASRHLPVLRAHAVNRAARPPEGQQLWESVRGYLDA